MVLFRTPAFSNSIFTYVPVLPTEAQVRACAVPLIQFSPPFGAVTVSVWVAMVKSALLVSVMAAFVVLVTLIV